MFDASRLALTYLLIEWVIRLAMVVILPMRRSPEAARSWLLFVLFLPVPALILYRFIGRAQFPAWRQARFADDQPFRQQVARDLAADGTEQSEIQQLAETLGGFPACAGNSARLLSNYDGTIAAMIEAIDAATIRIRLQTYIFADDRTGKAVVEALARARERGVPVHVLVDALGSRPWAKRSMALLRQAGVEARLVLPVRFAPLRRARTDLRNHRKLCLVDGRIVFVGSQNIVNRDFKPGIVNDELVARVEGPVVAAFDAMFASDWYLETGERLDALPIPAPPGSSVHQAMPSGPDFGTTGYERLLVELVHRARREVTIVSPYLIPDQALITAVKNAAARSVSVNLVVSQVVDQRLVSYAQRSYYQELLEAGARLHGYRRHLLHAKSVAIDDTIAVVGSSNVDMRSFALNAEISLILHGADAVAPMLEILRGYLECSDELTLPEWRARPQTSRLLENLARLVSPLL
ncbi:cardiolipin synthetase 2 [Novosphingobium sp. PhB165]|uniref:cardiolipin synthase n=1 Tax=Novosphingobium sp. PhB165 TaxID=2485105 RepID=UPI0010446C90|nr:cardiolipin synthase [Novosphingobium sp. PhB165]TCM20841.1 cardiolipin synthetase 2 [Novosphingobium sp. PhB165]